MITHVVLFKLKDRSPRSIEKAKDVLMGLKGKVNSNIIQVNQTCKLCSMPLRHQE